MDDLAPSSNEEAGADPMAVFTQPDPTYSTLYFAGSDLEEEKFGLDQISEYKEIVKALAKGLGGHNFISKAGRHESFSEAIESMDVNEALVITKEDVQPEIIHSFSRQVLRDVLEKGWIILYKREAKDGFDLHIFSKENIYTRFFYPLQKLLPDSFRFFSINGKRLSNERQFFFETWTLHKPPHGFEEVFPESVL
jgi:hypothetical protein